MFQCRVLAHVYVLARLSFAKFYYRYNRTILLISSHIVQCRTRETEAEKYIQEECI